MYGTSYSGFNSLQLAAERPPGLEAIIAIYATDDRYTDDVHYMGGALQGRRPRRLRDLHDRDGRAAADARAGAARRLARRVGRARSTAPSRGCCAGSRSSGTARTGGTARCVNATTTATGSATSASTCPTMIVAGWADGYRNNTFRTFERLPAGRAAAHRAVEPHEPGELGARSAHRLRARDDPLLRHAPARRDRRRSRRRRSGSSCAARPPPSPTSRSTGASGAPTPRGRRPTRTSSCSTVRRDRQDVLAVRGDVGTTAWISCAGYLPWGQPTDQRPDDGHVARLRLAARATTSSSSPATRG